MNPFAGLTDNCVVYSVYARAFFVCFWCVCRCVRALYIYLCASVCERERRRVCVYTWARPVASKQISVEVVFSLLLTQFCLCTFFETKTSVIWLYGCRNASVYSLNVGRAWRPVEIQTRCHWLVIVKQGPSPFSVSVGLHGHGCPLLPHTPSIAFRHLPPNSATFSYTTEGAFFISAQLSRDAVSALRKVRVLIRLLKQPSALESRFGLAVRR